MLSADALAPVLEEQYGCDVSRCRLIKALILHTYHAVAGEEQYIFRIYPCARRTETAIMAELKLLSNSNSKIRVEEISPCDTIKFWI